MLEELYEQYGQFLVMGLVFLVGFAVFYAYKYYKNQEDIKNVNNNIKLDVKEQPVPVHRKPDPKGSKPDFVPSDEFKGKQPGYTFRKGDKGQGYYMDK